MFITVFIKISFCSRHRALGPKLAKEPDPYPWIAIVKEERGGMGIKGGNGERNHFKYIHLRIN